jgi:dihydroorotase-like cyclic amidohydrolase
VPDDRGVEQIARLGSTNVAQIFNLAEKGSLMPGKDADIVVLDPHQPWTLTGEMLYSKCGWSLYCGQSMSAKVVCTYLRGEVVQQNGQIIGEARGKQIKRTVDKH